MPLFPPSGASPDRGDASLATPFVGCQAASLPSLSPTPLLACGGHSEFKRMRLFGSFWHLPCWFGVRKKVSRREPTVVACLRERAAGYRLHVQMCASVYYVHACVCIVRVMCGDGGGLNRQMEGRSG